jgi:hypothetical protein
MAHHEDRPRWKHDPGVYRRFTLVPFAYALVLTIPAELMLLALDLGVAMVALLVLEVIIFLLLPHIGWVRRVVDERIDATARADAAATRAVLLMRMSEPHRRELHALEKIAAALYERSDTSSQPGDCIGIERLIELYVRLAIAHRASCNSLEVIDHRPEEEMASLEMGVIADNRPHREWMDRRLKILQMRREARSAALDEQALIRHELALIGDTLRWMQETCASAGTEKLRAELDFALANRDRDASTLRDLAALRETDFDATVIRLGRDLSVPTHDPPHTRIAMAEMHDEEDIFIRETEGQPVRTWAKEGDCALRASSDSAIVDATQGRLRHA